MSRTRWGGRTQWTLPNYPHPQDQAGWSDFEINTLRFPGHPQETTENSVDLAHLRYVHGYDNVNPVVEAAVEGPNLETRFDFERTRTVAEIGVPCGVANSVRRWWQEFQDISDACISFY